MSLEDLNLAKLEQKVLTGEIQEEDILTLSSQLREMLNDLDLNDERTGPIINILKWVDTQTLVETV
jgi:hypothetical protein